MPSITLSFLNTKIKDTFVAEYYPSMENSTAQTFGVGAGINASGSRMWGLIKFDLGLIPNDAIINSATLRLKTAGVENATADKSISIHNVLSDWVETVTWSNKPAFDGTAKATGTASKTNNTDNFFNVTAMVQEWVNGTTANNGMLLKETPEGVATGNIYFYASNAVATSDRPTLTIDYTIPTTGKKQVEVVGNSSPVSLSGTSFTPTIPATALPGDLLVAHVSINGNGALSSMPVGWTTFEYVANGFKLIFAYKFMTAGEQNPNFTTSTAYSWNGLITVHLEM